ncbi:hypothetical protein [Streptomyces sp. NPDC056165]|uniref:hypothetical protein n=1 Tax=Streptomyces sp. NPDC056165 TaxID=3345733 RepID=UPI0035DED275
MLTLTACAVLTGATSLLAVGEWIADALGRRPPRGDGGQGWVNLSAVRRATRGLRRGSAAPSFVEQLDSLLVVVAGSPPVFHEEGSHQVDRAAASGDTGGPSAVLPRPVTGQFHRLSNVPYCQPVHHLELDGVPGPAAFLGAGICALEILALREERISPSSGLEQELCITLHRSLQTLHLADDGCGVVLRRRHHKGVALHELGDLVGCLKEEVSVLFTGHVTLPVSTCNPTRNGECARSPPSPCAIFCYMVIERLHRFYAQVNPLSRSPWFAYRDRDSSPTIIPGMTRKPSDNVGTTR